MAEGAALRGLLPEERRHAAERYFAAFPWEGASLAPPEPADIPAGAFFEAL